MLDPGILRTDPDLLRRSLERRGLEIDVAGLVGLDERRRTSRRRAEEVRAQQKTASKAIAGLQGDAKQKAIDEAAALSDAYKAAVTEADEVDSEFQRRWSEIPNLTDPSAADGLTEDDAVEIRRVGEPTVTGNRDHLEIGEALQLIDMERGARVSGSRFGYLKGAAVFMELALLRWVLNRLAPQGFEPVSPPVLVREHALYGTGFFPEAREQVYAIEADGLFLVGTSEVSLAAMHAGEILDGSKLPLRYAGFSTCFRRESGTYGKDTRGIFRVHQFDKVEMFAFVRPDESWDEHERLLAIEESILTDLEIPFRVVNCAAGDLGASAAKKYDLEGWFPSQGRYRELTSCSNTTDFQARRLNIRFREADGGPTALVHTLNGTAVAVQRTLVALLENYQQPDGSVRVPAALVPYTGFDRIGPRLG